MVFIEVVVDGNDDNRGFLTGGGTAVIARDNTVVGVFNRRSTVFSAGLFPGLVKWGSVVVVDGVSTGG